jgi:ABC-type branched-subunit amino acid transport system substrate-binding protein
VEDILDYRIDLYQKAKVIQTVMSGSDLVTTKELTAAWILRTSATGAVILAATTGEAKAQYGDVVEVAKLRSKAARKSARTRSRRLEQV